MASIWWLIMLVVRYCNFGQYPEEGISKWLNTRYKIRFPKSDAEKELISQEIKFHNEAIYKDFTFFMKVTLSIIAGVAFLLTQGDVKVSHITSELIQLGGWLQIIAGLLFSSFVVIHRKCKIERWKYRPSLTNPFTCQECWMVVTMTTLSIIFGLKLVPKFIDLLLG